MSLDSFKVPTVLVDGFPLNAVYALVALLLVALCYVAVRAPGLRYRLIALALMTSAVGATLLAGLEQLSFPKPLTFRWVSSQPNNEIHLLAAPIIRRKTERVEMLIDIAGEARFFWIPLTKELEESLRQALEKWANGAGGNLRLRIEPSWKKVPPQFYTAPWPAPPPKDHPEHNEPHRFKNDA